MREVIADCTARLVANRVAHKLRQSEIDALVETDRCALGAIELAAGTRSRRGARAHDPRAAPSRRTSRQPSREILEAVRAAGDEAVLELTRRFDSETRPPTLRVPAGAARRRRWRARPGRARGLETAIENVRTVAEAELADDVAVALPQGQQVTLQELPVRRAGVYVPGGRRRLSLDGGHVLRPGEGRRCASEVAVATPPGPDGEPNAEVLAACALCGVDEVYAIGGAQAIAALAFGTADGRSRST